MKSWNLGISLTLLLSAIVSYPRLQNKEEEDTSCCIQLLPLFPPRITGAPVSGSASHLHSSLAWLWSSFYVLTSILGPIPWSWLDQYLGSWVRHHPSPVPTAPRSALPLPIHAQAPVGLSWPTLSVVLAWCSPFLFPSAPPWLSVWGYSWWVCWVAQQCLWVSFLPCCYCCPPGARRHHQLMPRCCGGAGKCWRLLPTMEPSVLLSPLPRASANSKASWRQGSPNLSTGGSGLCGAGPDLGGGQLLGENNGVIMGEARSAAKPRQRWLFIITLDVQYNL